ncbi:MAG: multicopper oxidase domain-containing protein [Actinomycetota bacterium]
MFRQTIGETGPRSVRAIIGISILLAATAGMETIGARGLAPQLGPDDQVCDDPTDSMSLFAERLKNGKIGYGRTRNSARIPGPTIQMEEGDCLQINLVNDTDERLSFHPHGVDYTVASDGTRLNNSCVEPGRARTYVVQAHAPNTRTDGSIDPGSAGYWHYHDHCMGTPHGTTGIKKGLFGALVVRRAGDLRPDRAPHVLVMQGRSFNLKRAPRTPTIKADLGERVEFIVIGHGELFHTFHLHGHRWADNRTGVLRSPADETPIIDNRVVGPADSFGFQVIAGEHVGPGAWMYHCHVQGHSDAGMAGIFAVRDPDGTLSKGTRDALRSWSGEHGGAGSHHGG